MISAIFWDPNPDFLTIPFINWPIKWYGVFFAFGFVVGFPLFVSILSRFLLRCPHIETEAELKKKAIATADRATIFIVLGTVIGARLGHFFFYESPSSYLKEPLAFFRVWEGGLASHGAAVGIVAAAILFSMRTKILNSIKLLDFIAVPAAFGGFCIRMGNFFNQEVLGTPTNLPWGVVFGHPIDRSAIVARHPVQLYEALFYLAAFFFLWRLSYKARFLMDRGKLIGLFLVLVFGFRFCIEFFKTEQSYLLSNSSWLSMGQILSLPVIAAGLMVYFCIDFFYRPRDNKHISEERL